MIAALYVERDGVYYDLPNVDPWDAERDARLYRGLRAQRPVNFRSDEPGVWCTPVDAWVAYDFDEGIGEALIARGVCDTREGAIAAWRATDHGCEEET